MVVVLVCQPMMKNKDKDKIKMATGKTKNLTANESASRKEVGVQDSMCTTVLSMATVDGATQEVSNTVR